MPKPLSKSMDVLFNHVAKTLPDSTRERRQVLEALDNVISAKHPAHAAIGALLAQLEVAEKLQMELALKFQGGSKPPTGTGNGHES